MSVRWRCCCAQAVLWVALGFGLTGCASAVLAPRIVTAPNTSPGHAALLGGNHEARIAVARLYAMTLRVPVGPPPAEIALGVLEPGDYRHEHTLTIDRSDPAQSPYRVHTRWEPLAGDAPRIEPKGTIVLLHGFWMRRETVLHWAIHLAEAGYRTVPVDLRGHGDSTGPWVTFGAREAADLAAVLDELQRRDLAGARVGVLGISYGGSVALLWAARDPRVATVVALEPFADPRLAIRQYARAMLSPAASRALSDRAITAATKRAARLAAFSWAEADVTAAVARLRAPVLFIHGTRDTVLPPEHSRRLHAVAPAGSRLLESPADDHHSLSMRLDDIGPAVVAWLDAHPPDPP